MGIRSWQIPLAVATAVLLSAPVGAAEAPVDATQAYRETFGPPPSSEAGGCTAAVTYLPGVGASGRTDRLSALPLFSVSAGQVQEQAARVVVQGYPTPVRLFDPPRIFPAGSRLLGVDTEGAVTTVRVEKGPAGSVDPLALQALALTLSQFQPQTGKFVLAVSGEPPRGPEAPNRDLVEPPAPPRLLDVVSSIHEGEEPEEIDVLFDRPVDLLHFAIRLGDGTGLPGKAYVSMFDMAAVYRPEDPKVLREGLPLRLEWSVRDKTGRESHGERAVQLRIYRHPQ